MYLQMIKHTTTLSMFNQYKTWFILERQILTRQYILIKPIVSDLCSNEWQQFLWETTSFAFIKEINCPIYQETTDFHQLSWLFVVSIKCAIASKFITNMDHFQIYCVHSFIHWCNGNAEKGKIITASLADSQLNIKERLMILNTK